MHNNTFRPIANTTPPSHRRRSSLADIAEEETETPPVPVPVPQVLETAGAQHFAVGGGAMQGFVEEEIDRLLLRFPQDDPQRLRTTFLARLEQRLDQVVQALEQPETRLALEAELTQAQAEIEALLPAASLAAGDPQNAAGVPMPDAGPASTPPFTPTHQLIYQHLLSGPLRDDVRTPADHEMLRRTAGLLVAHGVDTPVRLHALLADAWRHDRRVDMACAGVGQLGYGLGYLLFNNLLAPLLAPRLLNRGFLPAFGFGYIAGLMLGMVDALGTAGLDSVAAGLRHGGPTPRGSHHLLRVGGIGASANFMKNFLLRVVLASTVMAAVAPEGVGRARRAQVDMALDITGGPLGGALGAWMRYLMLDTPDAHGRRLLSQADLGRLLDRMQRSFSTADLAGALRNLADGLGRAAVAPSTYLVLAGAVAPMIGLLLAAQNAVPPGVGLLTQVAAGTGTHLLQGSGAAAVAAATPVRADENAMRAMISSLLMMVMSGCAAAAGSAIAPRIDARTFHAGMTGLQAAVAALRSGPPPAPDDTLHRRSVSSV